MGVFHEDGAMEENHEPIRTEPETPIEALLRKIGDRRPTDSEMRLLMLLTLLELQGDD